MPLSDELWARLEAFYDAPRDRLIDTVELYDSAMSFPGYTNYDRDGEVISAGEAMLLAALDDYRQVDDTMVGELRVSTVWLGWSFTSHIFETAVFGAEGSVDALQVARYRTEEEARVGHRRMVENCTKARRV